MLESATHWCIRSPEWRWSDGRANWLIQPIKKPRGASRATHHEQHVDCVPLRARFGDLWSGSETRRWVILELRGSQTWSGLVRVWPDYPLLLPSSCHSSSSPSNNHFQTKAPLAAFSQSQFNYTIAPQSRWVWAWNFLANQFYIITAVEYSQADLTVI